MEEEVDLISLVKSLHKNRKTIIIISTICLFIGSLYSFSSENEYTSNAIIVIQSSDNNKPNISGSISGLASLAGLNFSNSVGETLLPQIYPKILNSYPFQRELMNTKIMISGIPDSVTIYDYYTDNRFRKTRIINYILDYTIGLPLKIISLVKTSNNLSSSSSSLNRMTLKEQNVANVLSNSIIMTFFEKEGYIKIRATTNDASFSCQLVQKTIELLQTYVIRFKVEKATSNLVYVEKGMPKKRENLTIYKLN